MPTTEQRPSIEVHAGWIHSYGSGYEIRCPGGELVREANGEPFTRERALEVLDLIKQRCREKSVKVRIAT